MTDVYKRQITIQAEGYEEKELTAYIVDGGSGTGMAVPDYVELDDSNTMGIGDNLTIIVGEMFGSNEYAKAITEVTVNGDEVSNESLSLIHILNCHAALQKSGKTVLYLTYVQTERHR